MPQPSPRAAQVAGTHAVPHTLALPPPPHVWVVGHTPHWSVPPHPSPIVPHDTALGAVVAHLQNAQTPDFQPANVSWTFFSPLPGKPVRDKRERRRQLAERALAAIDAWAAELAPQDAPLAPPR